MANPATKQLSNLQAKSAKAKSKRTYKPEADKRFTMNMDAEIHKQLKQYCFDHNETMGDVIENLITTHLKRVKIRIIK